MKRSSSPELSETLGNHHFITSVIPNQTTSDSRQKDNSTRKSLEELSQEIKELEDFITVTEDILRKERERDQEFYARERQRKMETMLKNSPDLMRLRQNNKENKSPIANRRHSLKHTTYRVNNVKTRKTKSGSPRSYKSRLYFRNGRVGCVDSVENASNVQGMHEVVKNIIKLENDRPLVSPENVNKILSKGSAYNESGQMKPASLELEIEPKKRYSVTERDSMITRSDDRTSDSDSAVVLETPIEEEPLNIVGEEAVSCDDEFRSISAMEQKTPMPGSASSILSNAS